MKIPEYIKNIIDKLEQAGHEAYAVGGCVRDLLRSIIPKDWDITTNAKPEEILKIFPDGKYENVFGTVIIPVERENTKTRKRENTKTRKHLSAEALAKEDENKTVVEVTTYRSEQGYSDRRHPDEVRFEDSLEKDLSRRDFTINAMAVALTPSPSPAIASREKGVKNDNFQIIDLFGGQKDIKKRIIRAVGEPSDRFKEDALRMMRAIRLACELNFDIEPKTERAIKKMAGGIKFIANERIKDELIKILKSNKAYEGIMFLHQNKLLQYIMPELERGVGVGQCKHHIHSVFRHCVLSLKFCPSNDWRVKLAALLHDIAKPQTKKIINGGATFYNHDIVGAKIAKKIMSRMKFSNDEIEKVAALIRNHMFYYNVDEVTASSVRRLIKKVGEENLKDLIDLRIADRLGSGVPKAKPYKLRHLEYMMEKVRQDPLSVKMLKINGDELMKLLKIQPSPKIGAILDVLLSEVVDDPDLNNKEYLENRSQELNKMELKELRGQAKEKIEDRKMEDDSELKKEFWVK
ncbi:CCA tRNA nucleotidyltransferase [Patescibacteria group bacterium]|nr:CCA tRNA nucleotidyltransferase [Candidatus Falkowbacteria bacterium]MBU3905737.1 CCA tRNA nucleotidyltransferase [Patescibacteria group bacterium]MCG2697484.1 CCA tRNA nucleotidyltransferase [Candidatus Parcubacteria bacterium]MBU4015805.1 CCA tRNA nucleotidyltransferase [Patescibacteria group bacterium]MBU4026157.1 CCA tRNA nucleotidyltransferase [Patescibacteria group bacterium]